MEGVLWGIVGGSACIIATKGWSLFRKSTLQDAYASVTDFFSECKAESEAVRVAIDEVRHPPSSKVVRIY